MTPRFAAAIAIAAISSLPAAAQSVFSNAFLRGPYTLTERSFKQNNYFETAVGRLEADGNGGVKGTAMLRVNGRSTVPTNVTGSYAVNPDGSGLLQLTHAPTVSDAGSGPFTENFRMILGRIDSHLARVDNGVFTTGILTAQVPLVAPGLTFEVTKGDYLITETGQFGYAGQFNWLGKLTLDDKGKVRGSMVYQGFDQQNTVFSVTGDYTVNPNGTGTLTFSHLNAGQLVFHRYSFVAGTGSVFSAARIDSGAQTTVAMERQ